MKKSYLALGLVAAVAMSSCSNDEPMPNGNGNQNLAQGYEPVKLSMTTSTADVEVSGARTRGTGTVGSMDESKNLWQYEDIYVLMTSTQTRKHYPYWQTEATWGFTSALGNGPFLFDQFDGSFWARPKESENNISVLDYTLDRNEWWWGGSIDRFYPLTGSSHFFAYYIDDAVADSTSVDVNFREKQGDEAKPSGREYSHDYPTLTLNTAKDAYSVKFDLDGSQDLMAGYAPIPTDQKYSYAIEDNGFSARSARQGAVPQITMKHLLSRLTFEVVKGGKNFDRVTLKGIKVESQDKGDMVVAVNPNFEATGGDPWENVGKITWAEGEGSTESFALKQVPNKYLVDENGKVGTYKVDPTTAVYYNIYDGLYANVKITEKVTVEKQDSWFDGENFKTDTEIEVDGVKYTVEEEGEDGNKSYFYTKTTTTKTTLTEDQVDGLANNPAAETSLKAGKAKLVDFADVDLKNFGLEETKSKSVGEAMFVAPGVSEYTLSLEMAYLVRDGEAEEKANLEQAVAVADAQKYAKERALKVAQAVLTNKIATQNAAQTAFNAAETKLNELKKDSADAQTVYDEAVDALEIAQQSGTDTTAESEAVAEAETKLNDAKNAITAYLTGEYKAAKAALDTANEAVAEQESKVAEAKDDLAEAEDVLQAAKDKLAKFEPVVEEMTQDLTVKLPNGQFTAGKSYNIRITIYGYEPAEVEVKLTPWLDGGHFDVGGDDDDPNTGDYYQDGNHEVDEDN